MSTDQKQKYLSAMMMIPASEEFSQFAEHLSRLMPGFVFKAEESGRYEEIPAFEALTGEMHFLLLGIPVGDEDYNDEYRLEFSCATNLSLVELLGQSGEGFGELFLHDKPSNSRGFYDYSQELADLLISLGVEGCKPIILGD